MGTLYNIAFKCEIVAGFEARDVKASFSERFNRGDDVIDQIFSGSPITLAKNLEWEKANTAASNPATSYPDAARACRACHIAPVSGCESGCGRPVMLAGHVASLSSRLAAPGADTYSPISGSSVTNNVTRSA